ncbi:hypothetical protein D3C80_877150 [compost metagenome]
MGFISSIGLGICVINRDTFPVLVIVCHWSLIRPVVSINGKVVLGTSEVFSIAVGRLKIAFCEGV